MNIKVRLLRDWNYQKQGEVVAVYEPTARNWIFNGIAEEVVDSREVPVERAIVAETEAVERAMRKPSQRKS